MSCHRFAILALPIVLCGLAGCADRSPAAPSNSVEAGGLISARPGGATPGRYELSFNAFRSGVLVPVSSLTVLSEELILTAHVTDSAGVAATSGTVTFEYCSYKGLPPNDITRADEAPMEACADGSADWARLTSVRIDAGSCPHLGPGYACMDFGVVQIPRKVGFRFSFSARGGPIASYVILPLNFEWTAG
jgi:hypothetical protein